MAKAEIKMPEDFLQKVSRLGEKTDEIIPRILEAGGNVVLDKVKSNLSSVVGSGTKGKSRSTGELERSLGLSPAMQNRDGNWDVKIGFSEPRSDGKGNAMIAGVLEYGKSGQPPRPFLKPARTQSRSTCIEAMKAKFQEEVDGI